MIFTSASPDEVWPLIRDHHYSARMPSNIQTKEYIFADRLPGGLFGDGGAVLAAIVFGFPAGGIWPRGVLELQRLARVPSYSLPLSRIISLSVKWLKSRTAAPFLISYADPNVGHHGGVYQASGWTYVGQSKEKRLGFEMPNGEILHRTSARKLVRGAKSDRDILAVHPDWKLLRGEGKHLYAKGLTHRENKMLKNMKWIKQPYPKPNAACLSDDPVPTGVSREHTPKAAPKSSAKP